MLIRECIEWCRQRGFDAGIVWSLMTLVESLIQTDDWTEIHSVVHDLASRYGVGSMVGTGIRGWQVELALQRDEDLEAGLLQEPIAAARAAKDDQMVVPTLAVVGLKYAGSGELSEVVPLSEGLISTLTEDCI